MYRTYEPNRDRLVSVKIFRIDLLPEQAKELADALQGLVEIGLDHPSIVAPLAAGIEGHTVYLAEEYVAGESLDIALRHYAPAPLETALPYLAQLAGALDYARARGVGHGALHPRDIFLTPDLARATGFGITQALERIGVRPPVRRPFSAPERVAGRAWSTPADVFALGAVAHELLTGKRSAGTGEVAPIAGQAAESHPELLRAVLARALADDPAARYGTASAFVSALEAASRGEGGEETAPRELAVELDEGAAPAIARVESAEEPTFELDRGEPAAPEPVEAHERAAAPEPEPEPAPRPAAKEALAVEAQPEEQEPSLLDLIPAAEPEPRPKRRPRRKPEPEPELEPQAPFAMAYEPEPAAVPRQARDGLSSSKAEREAPVERVYTRAEPVQAPPRLPILPFAIVGIMAVLVGFFAGYLVGSRVPAAPPAAQAQTKQLPAASSELPAPGAQRPPAVATPPAASRQPSAAGREWSEAKVEPAPPAPTAKPRAPETPAAKPPAPGLQPPATSRETPAAKAPAAPRAAPRPAPSTRKPVVAPAGTGTLVAESRPTGARVVLDGRAIGKTPLKLGNVKAGTHTVRLEIGGYRVWSTEVTVVAGRETRVAGSLDRIRNP